MRLWGLTFFEPQNAMWLPLFLAEFLCTTGSLAGPGKSGPNDQLGVSFPTSANLCDTITLTQGTLGPTGEINSTGPGTGIPAWATVELKGSQWLFFDFLDLPTQPERLLEPAVLGEQFFGEQV